jgi:hypothetical protein
MMAEEDIKILEEQLEKAKKKHEQMQRLSKYTGNMPEVWKLQWRLDKAREKVTNSFQNGQSKALETIQNKAQAVGIKIKNNGFSGLQQVKSKAAEITKQAVKVRDNGKYFTVSRADSTTDNGFGKYEDELHSAFNVTRLDGGSFDVAK